MGGLGNLLYLQTFPWPKTSNSNMCLPAVGSSNHALGAPWQVGILLGKPLSHVEMQEHDVLELEPLVRAVQ